MSAFAQFAAVTGMNLKCVRERPGSSVVIVIGVMGVVVVLISILTLGASLADSVRSNGRADRAIVLRAGADSESGSSLFGDEVQTILGAPGIARSAEGEPLATADIVDAVRLVRARDDSRAGVRVRGMSAFGPAVRAEIQIVEGRWFQPGLNELVVGRSAQQEFSGLQLGDKVRLRGGLWTVVGIFATGNALEGALLADATTLMSAYRRALVSSVTVRLSSVEAFDEFKNALTRDPRLSVDVIREDEYFQRLSRDVSTPLYVVSFVIGAVMAIGAIFGALNTMYTSVSNRRVEIATLRALGFRGGMVVASVLAEAMILAAVGAIVGAALAWIFLSGSTFSLGATEGSIVTQLKVTVPLVALGLGWACLIGLLGGVFPAVRAATSPIASELKEQ